MGVLYTEDFTSLTGYAGISGTGSAAADTEYVYHGTKTVLLTNTSPGLYVWGNADLGIDIDSTVAGTWVRVIFYVVTGQGGWFYIRFFSGGSLSNYAIYHPYPDVGLGTLNDGWHAFDIKIPATGEGGYDPTNITGIGFQFGHSYTVALHIDSVQFLRADSADLPTFIFTIDDGNDVGLTNIAPELELYGWKGAFGIVGTLVGTGGKLTVANLLTLQAAGHTIISHSYTHADWTSLTLAEREAEIILNKRWMQENGVGANSDIYTLAYGFPFGADAAANAVLQTSLDMTLRHNCCVLDTLNKFTPRLCRVANVLIQQWSPIQQRNYLARPIGDEAFTPANIDAYIASSNSGVIPIMLHVVATPRVATYLTIAEFQAACLHLREQELAGLCRVMSITEWLGRSAVTPPATLDGLTFVESLKLLAANQVTIKSLQPDYAPVVDSSGNSRAVSSSGAALATDATVSKPGTPQTITPPENMALAGEAAAALTANLTLAKLDSIVEVVP